MQKKEVKKPGLFLSVILPIVLLEILFILVSILSFVFWKESIGIAIALVVIFGCILLLAFIVSILIYLLRYFSYEKAAYPEGKFSIPALAGFIIVVAGYLFNALVSWIPFVGWIISVFFAFGIIAGGIVSIVALCIFKQGERGKGFANIGAFMGIYYAVHLLFSIILIVILWAVIASTLKV